MDINSIVLHPEFSKKAWVIVEQARNKPYCFSYGPVSGSILYFYFGHPPGFET